MKIDLEEIQNYVPSPMTHDFILTTIVAPHVESVPLTKNTSAIPAITENEDVPIVNEQQAGDFGTNEVPINNQQEVEPEQPQEEINDQQEVELEQPQEVEPVRRSLHERKIIISKDYVVYISEVIWKMDDPTSYKEVIMSENSKK
jgi:hypothetical protein